MLRWLSRWLPFLAKHGSEPVRRPLVTRQMVEDIQAIRRLRDED